MIQTDLILKITGFTVSNKIRVKKYQKEFGKTQSRNIFNENSKNKKILKIFLKLVIKRNFRKHYIDLKIKILVLRDQCFIFRCLSQLQEL
jgi:hypothetical protein